MGSRKYGMKITHVFETHVHADHVSGNMELQSRTGAEICFLEGTPVRFKLKPVKHSVAGGMKAWINAGYPVVK